MRASWILLAAALVANPIAGATVDSEDGPVGFAKCDMGGHVTWDGQPLVGFCCERVDVDVYYCYW